jgi:hypothetical protein
MKPIKFSTLAIFAALALVMNAHAETDPLPRGNASYANKTLVK